MMKQSNNVVKVVMSRTASRQCYRQLKSFTTAISYALHRS